MGMLHINISDKVDVDLSDRPFKLCHGQLTLLIIVMLFSLWEEDNDYKYNHIIKMLLKNPCLLHVVHFGKVKGLFSKTSLP